MTSNEQPLVTIGLPFYNPGGLFIDCLKSIFSQTYTNWELLLMNDGSTDGSLDIALSVSDPRVKIISDGVNRGLIYRLNQISEMANGQYLARMDADDMMHPRRIERQIEYLRKNPDVDIVDTAALILDNNQEIVGIKQNSQNTNNAYLALKYGVVLHATVMGKHKWFIDNPYDNQYLRAEDRELFVRVLKSSKIKHIPEPLYFYYYVGNVRIQAFKESYKSERKVIKRYGAELIGIPLSTFLLVRSYLKSVALTPLVNFNFSNVVTKNAYGNIKAATLQGGINALEQIKNTHIPGVC